MTERTDCIVVGAGVVGLAVARALARSGREVVILEAESAPGQHTSSRNTGCIHAGMGYVPGSLKSRLALRGKALMYQFCAEYGVAHRNCGKLVVAVDEAGIAKLDGVIRLAEANGLHDLRVMDTAEVREMEPELAFTGAVYSPSSGIVDQHELMQAILGDAEAHGASLALNALVEGGCVMADGIELSVGGAERTDIRAPVVINAAGLGAQKVARGINGIRAGERARTVPDARLLLRAAPQVAVLPSDLSAARRQPQGHGPRQPRYGRPAPLRP